MNLGAGVAVRELELTSRHQGESAGFAARGRVLAAVLVAMMVGASPAIASPSDLRLGPGGMWPSSPPGVGSARLVPSLSLAGGLRVGYSQRSRDPMPTGEPGEPGKIDRGIDGQVQIAVGLLDWIEIGGSIAGRLDLGGLVSGSDDSSSPVRAAALPADVQLKLALPGLRPAIDGPGTAAALALGLRFPFDDTDDRLAWRPSFLIEHRTGWGLLGACELGAELRRPTLPTRSRSPRRSTSAWADR